jgi:transcription antitermination factor NusG
MIELQWRAAHYCPGVRRWVTDGLQPARVPADVIAEIKSRERNGVITLPNKFKLGDQVRILCGPFRERLAIYAGMAPHERVAVLLQLLGSAQRVTRAADAIEAAPVRDPPLTEHGRRPGRPAGR